jgi:hypothetical protein
MATEDMPKMRLVTERFVTSYDNDDYDAIYARADAQFASAISKEKNEDQLRRIKGTTGAIVLGDQVSWNAQNFNGNKYISIAYRCTSDMGTITLTMKYPRCSGMEDRRLQHRIELTMSP